MAPYFEDESGLRTYFTGATFVEGQTAIVSSTALAQIEQATGKKHQKGKLTFNNMAKVGSDSNGKVNGLPPGEEITVDPNLPLEIGLVEC